MSDIHAVEHCDRIPLAISLPYGVRSTTHAHTPRRFVRAAVGERRDVRARRRRRGGQRAGAHGRAVLRGALQVLLRGLLHVPAVPARLPAGPGTHARAHVHHVHGRARVNAHNDATHTTRSR